MKLHRLCTEAAGRYIEKISFSESQKAGKPENRKAIFLVFFRLIWWFCFIISFLFLVKGSSKAQLDVRGFVDTYHAVRVKEPQDYLSSRTRIRLETFTESDVV